MTEQQPTGHAADTEDGDRPTRDEPARAPARTTATADAERRPAERLASIAAARAALPGHLRHLPSFAVPGMPEPMP